MGCCIPTHPETKGKAEMTSSIVSGSFAISPADFVKINTEPIISHYTFQNTLGSGGYAEVKKVIHNASNTFRAIKSIVISDCDNNEIEKLMKEDSILKELDHPNIIRVYEVYKNKAKIFIVTELCTGGELFDRIKELTRFTENQAAKYMLEIVSAVKHCHQHGIVHRDLKPENLLFENDSPEAKLKLIDFGTSQFFTKERKMRRLIGTYYYMAPEIFAGEYDEKCDVWSLGIILYIMLCGHPPFTGGTDEEITSRIQNAPLYFTGSC